MRRNCLEFHAILILFVIYITRDTNCEEISEKSNDKTSDSKNESLPIAMTKKVKSSCKGRKCLNYWMSMMGSMQQDLTNAQAVIVKDEDVEGDCDKGDRQSNKRYLMCSGSILNRNHVLTSASCIHTATHIRHNIRATLAVAIAPLKPSMQVIRVLEYKINPAHNTNPYGKGYLTHNLAILKLACRIEMENFHKIDLPQAPFVHTCSEENCLVATYRQIGRTRWVMRQIMAPHVPLPNRRRKQTMMKDGELRKTVEYRNNDTTNYGNYRAKRKLAEPPIFIGRYDTTMRSQSTSNEVSTNLTIISTTENSASIEGTTNIFHETTNLSHVTATSLNDDVYEDWSRPIDKERIRSFVVRSSDGYIACAQTGSAVMVNRTQSAVASVPCDDRQPSKKWGYTDIYDNLDWIHDILQDWNVNVNGTSPSGGQPGLGGSDTIPGGGTPGNFSSCSTCIFNFFIEIGCKDKNQCGNKTTKVETHKNHERRNFQNSMITTKTKTQRCSDSNGVGIDIGIGQGCEKPNEKNDNQPEYRQNWAKSLNTKNFAANKLKNVPVDSTNDDNTSKLEQTITPEPIKNSVIKEQTDEKDKYTQKDNSRISENSQRIPVVTGTSSISRNYNKRPKNDNKNRDRVSNEIGLQNIEGESTDWLAEVEKGLDISSEVKRELADSGRSP